MTVVRRAVRGIAWSAASGWIQLGVGLCTFAIIVSRLSPVEVGSFGAVTLLLGLVEAVTGTPFGEGLQQRQEIEPAQVHATFWVGLIIASAAAAILALAAVPVAGAFGAPLAAMLLPWATLGLPIAAAAIVPNALLARELRFGTIARASAVASIVGGIVAIAAILLGAGVWSLLLSDLTSRVIRLAALSRASRYRPSRPHRLGAIAGLMRFNIASIAIYLLGHLDRAVPRLLAGLFLGAQALGYLMIAQRVLDLLNQLVLSPLNSVTMAVVARVQGDAAELRRLVRNLYRLAAICAYPIFLGAIVLVPDLARLVGAAWQPAIAATQLLLLVGLRQTTGVFNIAIFRGTGDSRTPMILLGVGLALNFVLVPLGASYGATGVAGAVVVRTVLTWPLGCWFIRRTVGLSLRDQAWVGAPSLLAAIVMAGATAGVVAAVPGLLPLERLVVGATAGAAVYVGAILLVEHDVRRTAVRAFSLIVRGKGIEAVRGFRAGLNV